MRAQIAKLGAFLLVCYLILFVQLNRVTIFQAEELKSNENNTRDLLRDFDAPRGSITSADGAVLAQTVPTDGDTQFERQRVYPQGPLFAHTVGYFSLTLGSDGLEREYSDTLAGRTLDLTFREFSDLFVDRERVGNLSLNLRADAQAAARDLLGDRKGSVVALDPRSGAVLAMWNFPSFDPNALAIHDFEQALENKALLELSPDKVLLAKTYQERFFPGSTFKVVTAAVGLETGTVTADRPDYPVEASFTPPQTSRPLSNFGGSRCGGDLFRILRVSCNTAFARMGLDIGPLALIAGAEDFGFNDTPPVDLPDPAPSIFPTDFELNLPALAQSAIGQNDVQSTPLQMALVAQAVANDGEVLEPQVVGEIRDDEGAVVFDATPTVWTRAMSAEVAATTREAMVRVVEAGTARNLAIPGYVVGGKTGTAQLGTDPPRSHAWIIGFAGRSLEEPSVAVAVIVEGQVGASEQTGGQVAAPIARGVMEMILAAQDAA